MKFDVVRLGMASLLTMALSACVSVPPSPSSESNAPDGVIRAVPMPSAPLDTRRSAQRIVFGSCLDQKGPQDIWDRLVEMRPDLVLLLGDNVYGDVRSGDPSLPELKAAYMRLSESAPFARLRRAAPLLAVWDDHDYGMNDAGADFALKRQSEALFEHVWALPRDDQRRGRDGVYSSTVVGPEGRRVQIILLDTRFFRSPLQPTDEIDARGKERYVPDPDPAKTMLGAEQWTWLARELRRPAEVRVIASSIQVLADGHGWEAWRELPLERERLFRTIRDSGARNVVFVSGDRHFGALYREEGALPYAVVEATASSFNLPQSAWRAQRGDTSIEPGANRIGDPVYDVNFGVLDIDWAQGVAEITLRGASGETVRRTTITLSRSAP